MSYGHASWLPIAVFGAMFLVRALSSQRRRGGRQAGGRGPRAPFTTDPRGPTPPPPAAAPAAAPDRSGGMPAGWFRDPFIRHEQRFWSGTQWTDHVRDGDVPGTDPPPAPTGPDAG